METQTEKASNKVREWASLQKRKLKYPALWRRELTAAQKTFWDKHGYLVLPGFFKPASVNVINDYVDQLWAGGRPESERVIVDIFIETERERRVPFSQAPREARALPHKLNDLYLESATVRALILEKRLARILTQLLDGAPTVCNTLSLEYGSQQAFHTDSLYMTPPRDLNLVASWIALEDCKPEAGPLRYYPRSHLIPPYRFSHGEMSAVDAEMPDYTAYMRKAVEERGLAEERFCARKGDVFLWHSQLFHGGAPIENKSLTRRSLVTHYWRALDHRGMHGPVGRGRYYLIRPHQSPRP